jgi:hypothetical protein
LTSLDGRIRRTSRIRPWGGVISLASHVTRHPFQVADQKTVSSFRPHK